jgi:UDP:flavonoid glycosyltransferase YjiC (YdhE family)
MKKRSNASHFDNHACNYFKILKTEKANALLFFGLTPERMKPKKTILFFPFNLLAHYLRCLVLAGQYDRDVYDIYFLESAQYDGFVKENGFQTFSAPNFDAEHVMSCAEQFDFSWLEETMLEQVFLGQSRAIKTLKPDLVIGDTAPTLKMAAEYTRVEYIALMNGYMSPYYAAQRKISRSHPAFPLLERMPAPLALHMTVIGERVSFWKIHAPFRRLRRKYRLKPVFSYLWETQGDYNLICDDPGLFPQKNLPANYTCIGPLIYRFPDKEAGTWLAMLDPAKGTICVCMGSSGDWNRLKFLNDPAFAQFNIITAGDIAGTLNAPHITHRDFVDLPQVLNRCDLMICHGGNGTINAGVLAGVYMLCVSSNFEQEWNIEALEKRGLGKAANDFSGANWKQSIASAVQQKHAVDILNQ